MPYPPDLASFLRCVNGDAVTKTISKMAKPPLLPLTDCRTSRAARLLGCEFGDLISWAANGAFKLYLNLDPHEHRGFVDDPHLESIEGLVFDVHRGPRSRVILNERASYYVRQRTGYGGTQCIADLQGFWTISIPWLKQVHLKKDEEIMGGTVGIETVANDRAIAGMLNIALGEDKKGNPDPDALGDNIWILHEDLLVAHQIIHGTPSSEAVQPTANPTKSIAHGNTVKNEEKRDAIVNAAITAKEKWPEECQTTTMWASAISDHQAELFKGKYEGKCPRALSGVLSTLREELKKQTLSLSCG